ncbi:hypothetical protein IC617_02055 [Neiella sp. HB171785]|uniref:Uncharacterized protein n=1 Tax=Neiella litorisoli TaxID=2771431 RepID=A0A8J6UPF6_9GAMM|nr:hypothetical protein [Neiella litorisoli]MBD1388202.1 hypothetical protein [Neiella litorisoli]
MKRIFGTFFTLRTVALLSATLLTLASTQVVACQTNAELLPRKEAMMKAISLSDYVFVGSVTRLYRLPDHYEGVKGAVINLQESFRGDVPVFVDASFTGYCGISPSDKKDPDGYWPAELNENYVFAGNMIDGELMIIAVGEEYDATAFASEVTLQDAMAKIAAEKEQKRKKKEDDKIEIPEHLKIDHLAEFEDE